MATLISLSPNAEAEDVRTAIATLVRPTSWSDESTVRDVESEIGSRFPNCGVAVTSSGRTAIWAALEAAGIGDGDEVIIQAFTCVAVPAAVRWAGAQPVFAEIDRQTLNLDASDVAGLINQNTRAIIVQHTFGIPGPSEQLRQLADQHGILLIEDLAHALSSDTTLVGHIGILSFGRDKMLSSVFGGAVVSPDQNIIDAVSATQGKLDVPPRWWVAQQLAHPIIMALVKPSYFAWIGKALLVLAQKARLLSKAVTQEERAGDKPPFAHWRFSPALGQLLLRQLQKLDTYTGRRVVAVNQYVDRLPEVVPWRNFPLLRVPLRVQNKSQVLAAARERGLLLGEWYRSAIEPCSSDQLVAIGYQPGRCPQAEQAAKEVINLPTHPTMHATETQQVIEFVLQSTKRL